ncbi:MULTISPECIES: pyridoxamine 5'-phosphate oxidase family protein [Desulfococcus]|jgi:hypothetical protein|uniref:Pyridoxamine 5-phosphate oxidase-related FMN-binding protein n=1 Tax=Desulfococcus multivorans DSM 2059 TaxID=1121405 RepID=S7VFI2_DESML|nr:pyridoxamine 5'-phosphate oxidase family protein [Desulfococcus multivorans]AOY58440.1 pyridoxamine 5-phosphate oxidase-related protein, FMN-binding [Desulfococcus multivorans]AQV00757.1 pyridoxamine 5'-phosphate oxidase [Desulfococcus multivorans]EPR43228.1 pyridoxamine 5-phosphate oxidase-related FMN-binding protein [Desulfococcus multivorans DSM 2059]MDX9819919.1 pyridoxamine 5'-phosphate oxidase family protein [Desulfococcus multivorans]SJZ40598.1 Pyridoxamine 5'-phosphate oxidase [Desu
MTLKSYFEEKKGFGVLSTADGEGRVNAAVYSRPHVLEEGTVAFIMWDRLTHSNLQSNPNAVFLFREDGAGYKGKRLYLTKTHEEEESELLHALRRKSSSPEKDAGMSRFLVFFQVHKALPLIGAGEDA